MQRVTKILQDDFQQKQQYFQKASQEIAEKNLHLLKSISLVTFLLLTGFLLGTPLILPGWMPTPQHLLFWPSALLAILVISRYQKRGQYNSKEITMLCYLFEAMLFFFIILIDVLQAPDTPASFMPMLCVSMPTLLILPFLRHYAVILCFEAVYIIATLTFKLPQIAQYDIFNSIVGIAFSFSLAQIMMRLRIQDHETRTRYQHLSQQDSLSGLLNKTACQEAAEQYLAASAPDITCTMLVLDLDDFKQINDELGHYSGDAILQAIGITLISTFRASDIVGRFGGDEFLILIKDTADIETITQKCCTIQQKLQNAAQSVNSIKATCSIGGVLVTAQNANFDHLFQQADQALYQAKASGKNTYVLRTYHTEP